MRVLLVSTILYLLGVAAILFLRPAPMFHEDGRWKEFGLHGDSGTTLFPVWLFCIVWALTSYFITRVLVSEGVVSAVNMTNAATGLTAVSSSIGFRPNLAHSAIQAANDDHLLPLNATSESAEPPPAQKGGRAKKQKGGRAKKYILVAQESESEADD